MRFCFVTILFGLAVLTCDCEATRRHHGTRRPIKLCTRASCRGDYINEDVNVNTDAAAYGDWTNSFGESVVDTDSFGNTASGSHGAKGFGKGGTGARSSGRLTSGNNYGFDSSIGSDASAKTFGTGYSLSETRGDARSYNGLGGSRASSRSAGSGYGLSESSTRADASGYRKKRSVDIDAGTRAAARGDFTKTFGNSAVDAGSYGAFGQMEHGADAEGWRHSGARSEGFITADGFYDRYSTGSEAKADSFGDFTSSRSTGNAAFSNGFMRSSAGAEARSQGRWESSSQTSASANGLRQKRHTSRGRYSRRGCRYSGNCGSTIRAETDADAFGTITDSFGESNVMTNSFGSRGRLSHGASGRGVGPTKARSYGEIETYSPYGGRSVAGSGAEADAFGLTSFSKTSGEAESNGFSSSGSSSATASSQGFGYYGRRYKRSLGDRICIRGICYESVNTRTRGSARGDFTESFGDSSIHAQPGSLRALATHESIGRGRGKTGARSLSGIESDSQFGYESLTSGGSADAFGMNSLSWSSSKTEKVNGVSRTQSQSRGSASGRGKSAARSEAFASRH